MLLTPSSIKPDRFSDVVETLRRSRTHFDATEHEEGEQVARAALASATAHGDIGLQFEAWDLISNHAWRSGKLTVAATAAEHTLALLPEGASSERRAALHCRLALVLEPLDLHSSILRHATLAVELARDCGKVTLLCKALVRLGMARAKLGDWRAGVALIEQSLALARDEDDDEGIFRALTSLNCVMQDTAIDASRRGDTVVARNAAVAGLRWAQEAVVFAPRIGDSFAEVVAHLNLTELLNEAGHFEASLEACDTADALVRRHGYPEIAVQLLHTRANAMAGSGDLTSAVALLDEALRRTSASDIPLLIRLHENLCATHKKLGNAALALTHLEAVLTIERERGKRRADAELNILLERSEIQRTRVAVESAQRDAQMQRIRATTLQSERDVLEARANEMGRHALEDPLTGLPNRRRVEEFLDEVLPRAGGPHGAVCVAVIDLDHFKTINDTFGHGVGDDVLRAIGAILSRGLRETDLVGRIGGEEFMLLLERTSIDVAAETCERIRRSIETFDWSSVRPGLTVTASFGLCSIEAPCSSRTVIEQADAALYVAKAAGRNRVVVDRSGCTGG